MSYQLCLFLKNLIRFLLLAWSIASSLAFASSLLVFLSFIPLKTIRKAQWMDPITTLFFGLAYLFVALIGVLIVVLGAISFVSLAFAIISMKTHKRINYKLCKIFSAISLNPFSITGAKMGLNICHDLKEAERFLNED